MPYPLPSNETERLKTLELLKILDTDAEREFDDLTRIAAQICGVPISVISLIDADRQWFKSKVGLDVSETAREAAFCTHTILKDELFIVPNATNDTRFAANPLVTGDPNIRFYAGAPLITDEGHALGSICVIDTVPRELQSEQKEALESLARQAMKLINLRRQANELESANDELNREIVERESIEKVLRLRDQAIATVSEGILISEIQTDDNVIIYANESFERMTGYKFDEIKGLNCRFLQGKETDPAAVAVMREAIKKQEFCAVEILNYCKDGTPFWNALSISPVKDAFGKVTHFVGVQQDITERRLADENLKASEKRYRFLTESLPQQVWTANSEGEINYGNYRTVEYFGQRTQNELFGMKWTKIIHPDDLAKTGERWSHSLKTGEHYETEYRLRRSDGEYRWHLALAEPMLDDNGKIIKWFGTNTDIHDRKTAEENARKSEAYRNLFRHANDAILIFEPESEIILDASDKAFQIYGRKREDFIGHSLREMSQNVSRGTEELEVLLREGIYEEFESIHLRGDGTPLNLIINAAVIDYQGKPAILTINRDVTARRKTENALREREEHFRLLVEGVEDYAIFMINPEGRVVSWNAGAERLKGYAAQEIIGEHFSRFYTAEDLERKHYEKELQIAVSEGRYEEEGWRVRKDGSRFLASVLITAIRNEPGQLQGFSKITRDITTRKNAENEIKESQARYQQLFDSNPHPIWVYDLETLKFLAVNEEAVGSYGYSKEEFFALTVKELRPPKDIPALLEQVEQIKTLKGSHIRPSRHQKKDGTIIDVEIASQPIIFDGRPARLVLATDITTRKRAEEQLLYNALHDTLTGLPNRALFLEHLRHAIERNGVRGRKSFAVLFLDFDHFKHINDSLGHMEGDNLLRLIAQRLSDSLRPGDIVARLGGDEFTILLDDLGKSGDVIQIVERIENDLKPPFNLRGNEVFTSASIGIALNDENYTEPEIMLRDADIAMYRAKANGKACHQIFNQTMHEQASSRLQLETELRQAVEREEFCVYFQPIINLQTDKITGFESLVRWQHPARGIVSPLEFIPIAEETGLIVPLGEWVLRESCRQLSAWQNEFKSNLPLTMSVNLSSKQFVQTDLVERIVEIIRETKIEACSLRLEITESHLMEDSEAAILIMKNLRALGIKLSIDDFGTGYSSLSYLHRLPVNYLKVDRSFVSQMQENSENREIVRTIISLAKNLNLDVIAEGIETIEQEQYLKNLDCNFGQGYLYSKPIDAPSATKLLVKNNYSNFVTQTKISDFAADLINEVAH